MGRRGTVRSLQIARAPARDIPILARPPEEGENETMVLQGAIWVTMNRSNAKDTSSVLWQIGAVGGAAAGLLVAALGCAALAAPDTAIPNLMSSEFGWQSNVSDWQDPPKELGHGPIKPDPEHPYVSNAEGGRLGIPPTKRIGNWRDPILKPWAAKVMRESNEAALNSGDMAIPFAAQARCFPGGVPGQLLFPFEPMFIIQTPKIVYMLWQRDHMVRRIWMTDKHSEAVKPTWFGESIGRYENGNTLVVDTIGLQTKNSFVDNFHTTHTEKMHVIERFTLEPGGKFLTAIVTVNDPDTFNEPLILKQRWFKQEGTMLETVCAENNQDYFSQGLFPVPMADKPDF
jgi:hypothetical protein